jgi:hypothetical protein
METKQKKQEYVEEYQKNQQLIIQLSNRNQQIVGALQVMEELEKEVYNKTPKEEKGDKK